jgi:small conductance mechanosensitive channel
MQEFGESLKVFLSGTGLRIIIAFTALFFGLLVIKIVTRISKNSLHKTAIERTTVSFIISIIHFSLYILLAYIVADILFPDMSAGLIAALGSAALAIGLALKDSLSNFASGVIIIFTKPFREGDYVGIGDTAEGTVVSIGLLSTSLLTIDNKKIIISNSSIISQTVTNYSERPTRRIDFKVYVSYGSDIEKVKKTLLALADSHPLALKEPAPLARLMEQGDSALIFTFRVWVKSSDYWTLYYDLNESMLAALEKAGINVPYNQLTVHIANGKEEN